MPTIESFLATVASCNVAIIDASIAFISTVDVTTSTAINITTITIADSASVITMIGLHPQSDQHLLNKSQ